MATKTDSSTDRTLRFGVQAAVVVAVLVAAGYGVTAWLSRDAPSAASTPPRAIAVADAASPLPAANVVASSPATRPDAAGAAMPPAAPPQQDERFDALARSPSPADRFAAYQLAHQCLLEATFDRMPGASYLRQCSLAPGTWGNAERRGELLRHAALAGVPRAWFALVQEGPGGMFHSIPDSAEYRDLQARAYAVALDHADPFALAHEAVIVESRGDVARALTLNVASAAALARLERRAEAYDPENDPGLDLLRYRVLLRPDVVARAMAEGLKLAAKAK